MIMLLCFITGQDDAFTLEGIETKSGNIIGTKTCREFKD